MSTNLLQIYVQATVGGDIWSDDSSFVATLEIILNEPPIFVKPLEDKEYVITEKNQEFEYEFGEMFDKEGTTISLTVFSGFRDFMKFKKDDKKLLMKPAQEGSYKVEMQLEDEHGKKSVSKFNVNFVFNIQEIKEDEGGEGGSE